MLFRRRDVIPWQARELLLNLKAWVMGLLGYLV
jgi:hypothetical protein